MALALDTGMNITKTEEQRQQAAAIRYQKKIQKKALTEYRFAMEQEDRYLGSVFVNQLGIRDWAEKVKDAEEACRRAGVEFKF